MQIGCKRVENEIQMSLKWLILLPPRMGTESSALLLAAQKTRATFDDLLHQNTLQHFIQSFIICFFLVFPENQFKVYIKLQKVK